MVIADALRFAAARLAAVSETPRLDAELLLAHALGTTREALLLGTVDGAAPAAFDGLVARRLTHEPIAYILGRRDFWTIELAVGPGVLIPRPDSETLIEAAIDHFAGTPGPASVLDLGTGSGALLLAALAQWPAARGIGLDRSEQAVHWARRNVAALGMSERAEIVRGGWDGATGAHDLILCNPPYVADDEALPDEVARWEPAAALYAGTDGLDDYRALAPLLLPRLAAGGVACLEIGSPQGEAVAALFGGEGFATAIRRDLAKRDRCVVLRAPA